jgi:hypothetical protein
VQLFCPLRRTEERLTEINVLSPSVEGQSVAKKVPEENSIRIEETQAALRDSIERAKELVSEAKQRMRRQQADEAKPPDRAD